MLLNSSVIKKNKLPSFLLCEKNLMEFYSQFGWKKLSKTNIRIKDHTIKKKNIMHFNFKRLKTKFSIFIYQ